MRNRSRDDILLDMLRSASSPITKTGMMYKCMLSYGQLKHYHDFLKETGLIRELDRKKWIITDKGRSFMHFYDNAMQILRNEPEKQQDETVSTDRVNT